MKLAVAGDFASEGLLFEAYSPMPDIPFQPFPRKGGLQGKGQQLLDTALRFAAQ
jgi:hypothetical protein